MTNSIFGFPPSNTNNTRWHTITCTNCGNGLGRELCSKCNGEGSFEMDDKEYQDYLQKRISELEYTQLVQADKENYHFLFKNS